MDILREFADYVASCHIDDPVYYNEGEKLLTKFFEYKESHRRSVYEKERMEEHEL